MHRLAKLVTSLTVVALVTAGVTNVAASPAHADTVCGDTAAAWVPALGSIWDLDLVIDSEGYTGDVVFTSTGATATTVVVDLGNLVLLGNWDFNDESSFAWSGTAALDPTYRLTFDVAADSCNGSGAVTSATGSIIHQTEGVVGNMLAARVL